MIVLNEKKKESVFIFKRELIIALKRNKSKFISYIYSFSCNKMEMKQILRHFLRLFLDQNLPYDRIGLCLKPFKKDIN